MSFLGVNFFGNFIFGCFWLFLAVFGPLWACLGQGGNFIIHQMGWGLFLMVGSDSGTHFVIFGGCLRPQNTFLAPQMAKNGGLKPFLGPHGPTQFLQETRNQTCLWQQGPPVMSHWPPDARAALGCGFLARTGVHKNVTAQPVPNCPNLCCFHGPSCTTWCWGLPPPT